MENKINPVIEKFFSKTIQVFTFLETDFGLVRKDHQVENEKHYPDMEAAIRYIGKIEAKVFWYFAGAVIGVTFIELEKDEFTKFRKAASLYSLVDVINANDSKNFLLKNYRSVMVRDIKKREKIINENMEQVLENLAIMTKKYALDVLRGDTTIFPKIQAYEEELNKQNHR